MPSCIFCWLNGCSCPLGVLLSARGRWVGDWRGEGEWEGFPCCGKWNLTRAVPHRPILCPFGYSNHQFTGFDGEQPVGLSLCPCWKLAGGGWEIWEPFVMCNFSLFWDAVESSIMLSHKSIDLSLLPKQGFSHYLERELLTSARWGFTVSILLLTWILTPLTCVAPKLDMALSATRWSVKDLTASFQKSLEFLLLQVYS